MRRRCSRRFRDGGEEIGKIRVSHENLVYTVEATGNGLESAYSADTIIVARVSGEALQALDVNLVNVVGAYTSAGGTETDISGTLSADAVGAEYAFAIEGARSSTNYVVDGMDLTFAWSGPSTEELEYIQSTREINGLLDMDLGPSSGSSSTSQEGMAFDVQFESKDPSASLIQMQNGRFSLDQTAGQINYVVSAAAMGFPPFSVELGGMEMKVTAPLAKTNSAEQALVKMVLNQLVLSDDLWSMFDPGATIPRDPANVVIDVEADVNITEELPQASGAQPPFDVESVSINDITIQAGGAEILASGGADIDMSGPVPSGDGEVNITVKGLVGLTESLAGIGILTPDMVMGARGMLGVFGRPVGEDHFESQIVLSPDGSVTANGMPLPIQ